MLFVLQVPPQMGQMGGVPVMAPQPMMYNQPVLRPTNPFAPIPGAQVFNVQLLKLVLKGRFKGPRVFTHLGFTAEISSANHSKMVSLISSAALASSL